MTPKDTPNYSQEWITVGRHRILIEESSGPPQTMTRRLAMMAVWWIEWAKDTDATVQVAMVHHDVEADVYTIILGASTIDAAGLASVDIEQAISGFYDGLSISVDAVEVKVVDPEEDWSERVATHVLSLC